MSYRSEILDKIRNISSELKNAERRVAETVLKSPDIVVESTITELAEMAKTSEPTVFRFCKKIGLAGYMELRINLAKDLPASKYKHTMVDEKDKAVQVLSKVFSSVQNSIGTALTGIDTKVFEKAVTMLARAGRIDFFGLGGAGIVAMDAHHKFFRLGIPCNTYRNAHMQFMSAALLSKNTVVVAISNIGSSKDIIESVRIAKNAGAGVIGIIGQKKSPLHRICDLAFSLPAQEIAWFAPLSGRMVQIALLDALFLAVAVKKFPSVKGNLEAVKKAIVTKNL